MFLFFSFFFTQTHFNITGQLTKAHFSVGTLSSCGLVHLKTLIKSWALVQPFLFSNNEELLVFCCKDSVPGSGMSKHQR